MQFIAITRRVTEKFSEAQFEQEMEAERQQARRYYVDGQLRQIWHRADVGGAVLLLEAGSLQEAEKIVHGLPLHQKGMLETVALVPMKPYAGFGPR